MADAPKDEGRAVEMAVLGAVTHPDVIHDVRDFAAKSRTGRVRPEKTAAFRALVAALDAYTGYFDE